MNQTFWNKKKVLVTGGAGFVGRWVGRTLAPAGVELHILDLAPPKDFEVSYEFHQSDLRSLPATKDLLEQLQPAVIVHLAGQPGVQSSHDNPIGAYEANVLCTFNLLEASRRIGTVTSIVAVSSNHVYGEQHHMPSAEDAPLNGVGMYAASKLCADVLARTYGKTYGLPVGIARMANSFGPDDHHHSHIVTGTILSCLKGMRPTIRRSGRDRKGYLFIKDTSEGLLAVAQGIADCKTLFGEAFNLAPDDSPTVLDVVQLIMRITGVPGQPEILEPAATAETEHLDNSRAKRMLAWNPSFNLPVELEETIAWYREHAIPSQA